MGPRHDGSPNIVEYHPLANNVRAASKFTLPQPFRDHPCRVGAKTVFVRSKGAAMIGFTPRILKKACGKSFRHAGVRARHCRKIKTRRSGKPPCRKRGVHPPPVSKVRIGDGTILEVRYLLKQ